MHLSQDLVVAIAICFWISGFVKGFSGIGFITICISSLVFFIDLKMAIAIVFASSIASNLLVMMDVGKFKQTTKEFWPLYIMIAPGLALGVSMLLNFDEKLILQILATVVIIFCLFSLFRPRFHIAPSIGRSLLMPVGFMHGMIAGLTGTQSVPLIPFMLALKIDQDRGLQALNTTMTLGTLMTGIIFYQQKIMTDDLVLLSALCVVPTFVGVSMGNVLRKRIAPDAFKRVALLTLLAVGVSLGWKSSGVDMAQIYVAALGLEQGNLKANEREALRAERDELNAALENARRSLAEANQHSARMKGTEQELRQTLADVKDRYSKAVEHGRLAESKLQSTRTALKQRVNSQQGTINAIKKTNSNITRALAAERAAAKKLRDERAATNNTAARLHAEGKHLKRAMNQLKEQLVVLTTAQQEVERLRAENKHLASQTKNLTAQIRALEKARLLDSRTKARRRRRRKTAPTSSRRISRATARTARNKSLKPQPGVGFIPVSPIPREPRRRRELLSSIYDCDATVNCD